MEEQIIMARNRGLGREIIKIYTIKISLFA